MTWFDIAFYSILLFGVLIGIGLGLYFAFHISKHKLDRKEYKDYDAEERRKKRIAKKEAKAAKKREKQEKKQNEANQPETKPTPDIDPENNVESEHSGRMAEIVSEREGLESLTDFNCGIDGVDEQEAIKKAQVLSNKAYQYLGTKIDPDVSEPQE